jgi:dUTP pyrophosphatase
MIQIQFKPLNINAKLPTKAHSNDTGWDVYCTDDVIIAPGESKVVPIGLQLAFISPGYWIQVACRSGLGFKHNLAVHPGIIDEGYRGSLDILFRNFDGTRTHTFKKGDKVAQLVVFKNELSEVLFTDEVSETKRGEKGFGSSGTK